MPTKKTTPSKRSVGNRKSASTRGGKPRAIKVVDQLEDGTVIEATTPTGESTPGKKAEAPKSRENRLSALDAAARVLSERSEPMNTKAIVEAMATEGYWTSPGGKTPHATLYSAILREIAKKGSEARFVKAERGKFAAKG